MNWTNKSRWNACMMKETRSHNTYLVWNQEIHWNIFLTSSKKQACWESISCFIKMWRQGSLFNPVREPWMAYLQTNGESFLEGKGSVRIITMKTNANSMKHYRKVATHFSARAISRPTWLPRRDETTRGLTSWRVPWMPVHDQEMACVVQRGSDPCPRQHITFFRILSEFFLFLSTSIYYFYFLFLTFLK